MIWQDAVMFVVGVSFALALLPTVWAAEKPPRFTCLLTAVGMTVFVFTTWTLELYFTSINNALTAGLWWVLYWQARHGKKPRQHSGESEPPQVIDLPIMAPRLREIPNTHGEPRIRDKYGPERL